MNPFRHINRLRLTVLERAELFARVEGFCEKCSRKIPAGDQWDIDHIIPLALGGTNAESNLQVVCSWCHGEKTSDDLSEVARSKRLYAQHVVPGKFRRARSWGRIR